MGHVLSEFTQICYNNSQKMNRNLSKISTSLPDLRAHFNSYPSQGQEIGSLVESESLLLMFDR